jgi:hypothetical protein
MTPKYIERVLQKLNSGEPLEPGVHHVQVRHDDRCGIFDGEPCDCESDVELEAQRER